MPGVYLTGVSLCQVILCQLYIREDLKIVVKKQKCLLLTVFPQGGISDPSGLNRNKVSTGLASGKDWRPNEELEVLK